MPKMGFRLASRHIRAMVAGVVDDTKQRQEKVLREAATKLRTLEDSGVTSGEEHSRASQEVREAKRLLDGLGPVISRTRMSKEELDREVEKLRFMFEKYVEKTEIPARIENDMFDLGYRPSTLYDLSFKINESAERRRSEALRSLSLAGHDVFKSGYTYIKMLRILERVDGIDLGELPRELPGFST